MPGHRMILTVTTMESGLAPTEVERVARALTRLDSFDVSIVNGQARATIRFAPADDEAARELRADLTRAIRARLRAESSPRPRTWTTEPLLRLSTKDACPLSR